MKRVITIIAMTTSDCNFNCWYCYTRASRRSVKNWIEDDIEKIINNCSDGFSNVEFCWHGGEPLLLGKNFYQKVIYVQKSITHAKGTVFQNNIQTNGWLLNDLWLDFFQNNNFHIGLSLDAPLDVYKIHRKKDPSKLLNICEKIKNRNLPLGVLCVVSKLNVGFPQEIFNFYKSLGVNSFGLLPLKNVPLVDSFLIPSNEDLFGFYQKLFDLWMWTPNNFSCIEPFDTMLRLLLGEKCGNCSFTSPCLEKMITIDQEGNVVPCSSLVSEDFILGNILQESLVRILSNSKVERFKKLKLQAIENNCKDCVFLSICKGGCRADAYWFSGLYEGKYPFCESRKLMFEHIQKQLEKILTNNQTKKVVN
jgi:uncharacterized protein